MLLQDLDSPISAAADSLRRGALGLGDGGGDREYWLPAIADAERAIDRAGDMLQRMCSFVASGRITGRPESLSAMLDEAGLIQARSDAPGIEIVKSIPAGSDPVLVDRNLIEQVLAKIFARICESSDQPARVRVEAVGSRESVLIRIEDHGPGLSDYDLVFLFEPRFTATTSTNELGMAICKSIVEAHGGRMWAERRNGQGTAFCLSLPAAPDAALLSVAFAAEPAGDRS
jgi:two-component system sensor kinase FixL